MRGGISIDKALLGSDPNIKCLTGSDREGIASKLLCLEQIFDYINNNYYRMWGLLSGKWTVH